MTTPELKVIETNAAEEFDLSRFKSKRGAVGTIEVLPTALPHHKVAQAKDFVRLHPDEESYWSEELCFVNVPIKGQKRDTLHLIDEELAMRYLPSGAISRCRLALAAKPYDVFFLAEVPSQNLEENLWNATNIQGCMQAKTSWVKLVSLKDENKDMYRIVPALDQDSLPEPHWPSQSLNKLITLTFEGRMIMAPDHPGLLRLRGARIIAS